MIVMNFKNVLAFETSCDDTSVAVVRNDGFVHACLTANQDTVHKVFGGVVPEIASRNHTLQILPLVDETLVKARMNWGDIDGLVVTSRPGLIGSLLVAVVTAKTIALAKNKPFIGVNHLEGHLLAPFLSDDEYSSPREFDYPFLALAVSGGHTQLYHVKSLGKYEILGRTVDDAAGEALDKFAKHLGLGFPGGAKVDRLARDGDRRAFNLPRTMRSDENLDFSFSGLKAAGVRLIDSLSDTERHKKVNDLCASYQEAVVESLMIKFQQAQKQTGLKRVVVTGGVSANSRLRELAETWARENNLQLVLPPLRYCTDNAAMVGYAGIQRLNRGEFSDHNLSPKASNDADDFIESARGLR